jgi:peptide/nickel transport system permease protein
LGLLIILYILAIFAEFFAPYTTDTRFDGFQQSPPTKVHLIKPDGSIGLHTYVIQRELDPETFRLRLYAEDTSQVYPGAVLRNWSRAINSGACFTLTSICLA